LIINQLPTQSKSISTIIENAERNRIPVLFIVGGKTYIPQFNLLAKNAKISLLALAEEEVQPWLNKSFAIFNLSNEFREIIARFPPLLTPFADFTIAPELTPLFFQRIKNIDTNKPLIALGAINGRKTGYIFGEGIWRWRLFNYYFNQTHSAFNELVNQLVQYLALKENEDNFIIQYQPVYTEIDKVSLNAELYNDNYERIVNENIEIVIKNQKNEELKYTFDVNGNGYVLNTGNLPVGDYTFEAKATAGNQKWTEQGSFTVVSIDIEDVNTRADHQLLYQISAQTNGRFYASNECENLINELKADKKMKPVNYFQELANALLNFKWIFFLLLLLLSAEWFLRKFWGMY
jgi:hypothetical protein